MRPEIVTVNATPAGMTDPLRKEVVDPAVVISKSSYPGTEAGRLVPLLKNPLGKKRQMYACPPALGFAIVVLGINDTVTVAAFENIRSVSTMVIEKAVTWFPGEILTLLGSVPTIVAA
jgi:hypothetical protein